MPVTANNTHSLHHPHTAPFNAVEYINKNYKDSSIYEIGDSLNYLSRTISKSQQEHKELIKKHFSKFVECRTALDDILEDIKSRGDGEMYGDGNGDGNDEMYGNGNRSMSGDGNGNRGNGNRGNGNRSMNSSTDQLEKYIGMIINKFSHISSFIEGIEGDGIEMEAGEGMEVGEGMGELEGMGEGMREMESNEENSEGSVRKMKEIEKLGEMRPNNNPILSSDNHTGNNPSSIHSSDNPPSNSHTPSSDNNSHTPSSDNNSHTPSPSSNNNSHTPPSNSQRIKVDFGRILEKENFYKNKYDALFSLKSNMKNNLSNFEKFADLFEKAKNLSRKLKESKFIGKLLEDVNPEIKICLNNICTVISRENINFEDACYHFDLYCKISGGASPERRIENTLLVNYKASVWNKKENSKGKGGVTGTGNGREGAYGRESELKRESVVDNTFSSTIHSSTIHSSTIHSSTIHSPSSQIHSSISPSFSISKEFVDFWCLSIVKILHYLKDKELIKDAILHGFNCIEEILEGNNEKIRYVLNKINKIKEELKLNKEELKLNKEELKITRGNVNNDKGNTNNDRGSVNGSNRNRETFEIFQESYKKLKMKIFSKKIKRTRRVEEAVKCYQIFNEIFDTEERNQAKEILIEFGVRYVENSGNLESERNNGGERERLSERDQGERNNGGERERLSERDPGERNNGGERDNEKNNGSDVNDTRLPHNSHSPLTIASEEFSYLKRESEDLKILRKCLGPRDGKSNKTLDSKLKQERNKQIEEISEKFSQILKTEGEVKILMETLKIINNLPEYHGRVLFEAKESIMERKVIFYFLYKFVKIEQPVLDEEERGRVESLMVQFGSLIEE